MLSSFTLLWVYYCWDSLDTIFFLFHLYFWVILMKCCCIENFWCKGSARMKAHISWKERKERLGLERWLNSQEYKLPLQKTQAQVHPRKSGDLSWPPVSISYTYDAQTILHTEQPFTYFFKGKKNYT